MLKRPKHTGDEACPICCPILHAPIVLENGSTIEVPVRMTRLDVCVYTRVRPMEPIGKR